MNSQINFMICEKTCLSDYIETLTCGKVFTPIPWIVKKTCLS